MPALDGLRGIAVLLVLGLHHGMQLPETHPLRPWVTSLELGWSGVDLFFVLSGFLITGILLNHRGGVHYFRDFYARRALRILPPYFGLLAAVFLLAPRLGVYTWALPYGEQMYFWGFLSNWWQGWHSAPAGLGLFWSLAIEEQFYLVWPVVVLYAPVHRLGRILGAIILATVALRAVAVFSGMLTPTQTYLFTITRADALATGAWLAVFMRTAPSGAHVRQAAGIVATAMLALAGVYAVQGSFYGNERAMQLVGFSALASLYGAAIYLALSSPRVGRVMQNGVLRFFGTYSYTLYLVHAIVLHAVNVLLARYFGFDGGSGPALVSSFALSVAIAAASWHLVEKRVLRLKRYFE